MMEIGQFMGKKLRFCSSSYTDALILSFLTFNLETEAISFSVMRRSIDTLDLIE